MGTLVFGGGDPVNCTDPTGLSWLSMCFGFGYSGPEADSFDQAMSDDYWSGDWSDRATGAANAVLKVYGGIYQAFVGAKATIGSGFLISSAGYATVLEGCSYANGGIFDYINLYTDASIGNGDVIEVSFKEALGEKYGGYARLTFSTIVTCGSTMPRPAPVGPTVKAAGMTAKPPSLSTPKPQVGPTVQAAGPSQPTVPMTVMQHPGIPTHFSVAIEGGSHTHQVVTGVGSTRIVTAEVAGTGKVMRQATIGVDAAATTRQTELLRINNLGPYDKIMNSCVSHVCDVLRAGGVAVPEAQGSAQLRFLLEMMKKANGEIGRAHV
jgi:hypothetical protein